MKKAKTVIVYENSFNPADPSKGFGDFQGAPDHTLRLSRLYALVF